PLVRASRRRCRPDGVGAEHDRQRQAHAVGQHQGHDLRRAVPDRIFLQLHDVASRRPDPDGHARRGGGLPSRRCGRDRDRRHRRAGESDRCRSGNWSLTPFMRIDHLINGKPVAGRAYFVTINPATQEELAEVASGGQAEVHAAVAAAKDAFPKWAATPAPQRAKLMRKLGDLIAAHVPELSQLETNDTGQVIGQTGKQLVPRAADNFYYFAEMCTRVDGHTYPTQTHLNYTLFHPVGVCALISPWNVPFMTATWKVAPCLAFGNTAVLKMSE